MQINLPSLYQLRLYYSLSRLYREHDNAKVKENIERFADANEILQKMFTRKLTNTCYDYLDNHDDRIWFTLSRLFKRDKAIEKKVISIACNFPPSKYGKTFLPIVLARKIIRTHITFLPVGSTSKPDAFYNETTDYGDYIIFVAPPPRIIQHNRRLHCEDGPAFAYDDKSYYYLNGIKVHKQYVMKAGHEIDLEKVLKIRNVAQRGAILNKIGVARVMNHFGSKTLDKIEDEYELIELNLKTVRAKYLKIRDTDTKTYLLEGVPYEINSCLEALSWRINDNVWNPDQLT